MDDFHSVYFCTSVSSFFVISSNDNVPGAAKKVTGLTNAPLGQASSSSLSGLPVVMQKVSPGVSYVAVNEDTVLLQRRVCLQCGISTQTTTVAGLKLWRSFRQRQGLSVFSHLPSK